MMTDQERITLLEQRLAYYDRLIGQLLTLARSTPKGRLLLAAAGLR